MLSYYFLIRSRTYIEYTKKYVKMDTILNEEFLKAIYIKAKEIMNKYNLYDRTEPLVPQRLNYD